MAAIVCQAGHNAAFLRCQPACFDRIAGGFVKFLQLTIDLTNRLVKYFCLSFVRLMPLIDLKVLLGSEGFEFE